MTLLISAADSFISVDSASRLCSGVCRFDTQVWHIILSMSVSGERMSVGQLLRYSLLRKSVVTITDHPNMTSAVYNGR